MSHLWCLTQSPGNKRASKQAKGTLQQLFPSADYLILLHSLQSHWQHQRQVHTAAMASLVLPWPGVEILMPNVWQWQQRNMSQFFFSSQELFLTLLDSLSVLPRALSSCVSSFLLNSELHTYTMSYLPGFKWLGGKAQKYSCSHCLFLRTLKTQLLGNPATNPETHEHSQGTRTWTFAN